MKKCRVRAVCNLGTRITTAATSETQSGSLALSAPDCITPKIDFTAGVLNATAIACRNPLKPPLMTTAHPGILAGIPIQRIGIFYEHSANHTHVPNYRMTAGPTLQSKQAQQFTNRPGHCQSPPATLETSAPNDTTKAPSESSCLAPACDAALHQTPHRVDHVPVPE